MGVTQRPPPVILVILIVYNYPIVLEGLLPILTGGEERCPVGRCNLIVVNGADHTANKPTASSASIVPGESRGRLSVIAKRLGPEVVDRIVLRDD